MSIASIIKKQNLALKPLNVGSIETTSQLSAYIYEEKLLESYIKAHPKNSDKDEIALKVALIDFTNNTEICKQKKDNALEKIAGAISECKDFDEFLKNGNPEAVEIIANATTKNNFSFASKYCAYHSFHLYDDDFSIYDGIVAELLPFYAKECAEKITSSKIDAYRQEKNYKAYNELIGRILSSKGLEKVEKIRRKFDIFLWSWGKEILERYK